MNMRERASGRRHAETKLDDTFWADFPTARQAIEDLPGRGTAIIFRDIGQDQQVIQALREVREFLNRNSDQDTLNARKVSLAGYLFEEYAFHLVIEKMGMIGINGVVLSPTQTFEIYKIAHPDHKIVRSHSNLRSTLQGDMSDDIRIPDGIVVERNQERSEIKALCEYSLGKSGSRKKHQARRFRSRQAVDDVLAEGFLREQIGEYLAKLDPRLSKNLAPSSEFLFILIRPEKESAEGFRVSDGVCRVFVPFTREEFKDVIDTLIQDIRTSSSQQTK